VADAARVRGRVVLLVDDVVTTSSTVAECAAALRKAGAAAVDVLAAALAVPPGTPEPEPLRRAAAWTWRSLVPSWRR